MIWRTSLLLLVLAGPAAAETGCRDIDYAGNAYTVCEADLTTHGARLYWRDAEGEIYGDFDALPPEVLIATNGGMYHDDRSPVGHYREPSGEVVPVITRDGPGNFGLLPNGVLCLNPGRAAIIESRAFASDKPDCAYATQSGPMLVINGALHPKFLEDSTSLRRRGGVGVSKGGKRLTIAVSRGVVNFHAFGTLFREGLGIDQALFTDGTITRLFDRAGGRDDGGRQMGPILAITERGAD